MSFFMRLVIVEYNNSVDMQDFQTSIPHYPTFISHRITCLSNLDNLHTAISGQLIQS